MRSTWCTRAELSGYPLIQRHPRRLLVTSMHFIGLDIHKKTISYCVKDVSGQVLSEGTVPATRIQLNEWMRTLCQHRDRGHGSDDVHRLDLRSSAAPCCSCEGGASTDAAGDRGRQKKNDRIDASKICDCLRCDFLPECHMVSTEVRERRRTLRYRKLLGPAECAIA